MFGTFLQVIAALGILIALLILAFYVYNSEEVKALTQGSQLQKQVTIFSGTYDLKNSGSATTGNTGFSTSDPTDATYLDIAYSVNQKSGAEFSYSFWLYLDYSGSTTFTKSADTQPSRNANLYTDEGLTYTNTSIASGNGITPGINNTAYNATPTSGSTEDKNLQPVVLFVRGENVARVYKGLCYDKNKSGDSNGNQSKADVLIKSPLVKLENDGDVLTVEFNTTYRPEAMIQNSKNTCDNTISNIWTDMNAYKVAVKGLRTRPELQKAFFLVTITLQDTYPSDPISIRNKIRARIYINNALELDTYIAYNAFNFQEWSSGNSLKLNNGNLFVAPVIYDYDKGSGYTYSKQPTSENEIIMADLNYYNYALTSSQINAVYKGGFNKKKLTNLLDSTRPSANSLNYTPATFAGGLKPSTTGFN
jgi:hypothetical protein